MTAPNFHCISCCLLVGILGGGTANAQDQSAAAMSSRRAFMPQNIKEMAPPTPVIGNDIASEPIIKINDAGSEVNINFSDKNSDNSPVSITPAIRVSRSDSARPENELAVPSVLTSLEQRTPAFMDLERFRVPSSKSGFVALPASSRRHLAQLSDAQTGAISLPGDSDNDFSPESRAVELTFKSETAEDEEDTLDMDSLASDPEDDQVALVQFTAANLRSGVTATPMAGAYIAHVPGNAYLANLTYAPEYRDGAYCKTKTWRSPNLKHRPLYFEDASLERHGLGAPKIQPLISGVRFFSSVALLPQKVIATRPTECVYPMGHGRPGDCMPAVRERLPRRGDQ